MNFIMDLHTHTIAAGHAYSTLQENIAAAQNRGLQFLGLSEHGPAMPGGPHPYFFGNYKVIPRQYGNLRLLCGAEVNIMDYDGKLDLDQGILEMLDYVIASLHIPCVTPGTEAQNTRASIQAMRNPYVKILGHPDDFRYPLNRDEVVLAAKEEKVAIEINNSSLHPKSARQGRKEVLELLELCKKHRVEVLLGSDSHISYSVGNFDNIIPLLKETAFPAELIMNVDPENIRKVVNVQLW